MAFGFGSIASLVAARVASGIPAFAIWGRGGAEETASAGPAIAASRPRATLGRLSAEAEAALAPLDLPPDGPFDPALSLRPKLAPDAAARNFARWARALGLDGVYSSRSVYALYCEFSEVDHRPPVRDTPFLGALARTEGIRREVLRRDRGGGKFRRSWQWTIEAMAHALPEQASVDVDQRDAAPAAGLSEAAGAAIPDVAIPDVAIPVVAVPDAAIPEAAVPQPILLQTALAPKKPSAVIARFASEDDHPFSPARLRERQKSARRARFVAAASRKQRGALRRAA